MCSAITHPVVPVALASLFPRQSLTPMVVIAGAVCSIVPDFDVISFIFGIKYEDLLGHRGITHSIFFAVLLGALLSYLLALPKWQERLTVFLFLFLSTLSHAVLDAMTNGGLGVAFFAPFQNERYFFPFTPIKVSPIGVTSFFSARGWQVLKNEFFWVWAPSAAVYAVASLYRLARR